MGPITTTSRGAGLGAASGLPLVSDRQLSTTQPTRGVGAGVDAAVADEAYRAGLAALQALEP